MEIHVMANYEYLANHLAELLLVQVHTSDRCERLGYVFILKRGASSVKNEAYVETLG